MRFRFLVLMFALVISACAQAFSTPTQPATILDAATAVPTQTPVPFSERHYREGDYPLRWFENYLLPVQEELVSSDMLTEGARMDLEVRACSKYPDEDCVVAVMCPEGYECPYYIRLQPSAWALIYGTTQQLEQHKREYPGAYFGNDYFMWIISKELVYSKLQSGGTYVSDENWAVQECMLNFEFLRENGFPEFILVGKDGGYFPVVEVFADRLNKGDISNRMTLENRFYAKNETECTN